MALAITKRNPTPAMPDLKNYLTVEDAAKELHLHAETVREFLRYKRLEGTKIGRMWLVLKSSVASYKRQTAGKDKHDPRRASKEQ